MPNEAFSDSQSLTSEQMIPASALVSTYNGHTITYVPANEHFMVAGPEFEHYKDSYCTFGSAVAARTAIDKEVDEANKLRAKNLRLKGEVIADSDGNYYTIESINRQSGEISGLPSRSRGHVFPATPWVRTLVHRHKVVLVELHVLNNKLDQLAIKTKRTLSRIDAERYPNVIIALEKEIREKTALAVKMAEEEAATVETMQGNNISTPVPVSK